MNDLYYNRKTLKPFIHAEHKKSPYTTSQLHTDQTNNKLYLYEKTNTTTNIIMFRMLPKLFTLL